MSGEAEEEEAAAAKVVVVGLSGPTCSG